MARVRVQVDLTKARPPHIWMGFKNSDPNKGRWQKIQYEGIPDYCMYCKHQGHMDNVCTIKRRDEESQRRKELETEKQNKMKREQGSGLTETGTRQQVQQHIAQEKDYRDGEVQRQNQVQQQHTNQQQELRKGLQTHHEQAVINQEEQWQVQKRKQTKSQEQTPPKTAWRPVSPQYKATKNNMQQAPSTAGILSNIPIHNNYIDLVRQEQPNKGIAGDSTNKRKSDHEVQTIDGSRDDSPTESNHTTTNVLKDHVTDYCYNKTSGIDLSLPVPHSPNVIYVDAEHSDEVCGGMDGGCQEKTTNLQEGATKGGNLTHVLHEGVHIDLNSDLRASAPTNQDYVKAVHQLQEIQKTALVEDTGQGGHKQVDSAMDQTKAPKEYKQQKGQGAGTETNSQTQKKMGTAGIEGTQEYNNTGEETGEKTPIIFQNKGRTQDNIATTKQRKERDLSLKTNNKSQGRLSKKKRDTIKKKLQKEAAIQDTNKKKAQEQKFSKNIRVSMIWYTQRMNMMKTLSPLKLKKRMKMGKRSVLTLSKPLGLHFRVNFKRTYKR